MAGIKNYPKEDAYRGGCRVSWNYYKNKAKAEKCAAIAKANAQILSREGYDFGFCMPGSVYKIPSGEHEGKYEVCLP